MRDPKKALEDYKAARRRPPVDRRRDGAQERVEAWLRREDVPKLRDRYYHALVSYLEAHYLLQTRIAKNNAVFREAWEKARDNADADAGTWGQALLDAGLSMSDLNEIVSAARIEAFNRAKERGYHHGNV